MSRQLGSDKSSLPSLQSTAFSLYPHMAETEMERASKLSVSLLQFSSVQSLSRVRLFATLDCSTRGFPVYHQLPGLSKPIMSIDGDAIQASHLLSSPSPPAFNLVHWFCDAIQPSHLLSSPSPPAFNCSQHQGLCKWGSSSHQVAKVLQFQLQYQTFQSIFRTDLGWISQIS